MKKLMLVVLAVCCLAAGCFAAFAACANEHEHTLEYFEAQAPTCVDSGHKEYWHCTECGAYFGDAAMTVFYGKIPSVPATGEHSWGEWTGEVMCEHGGEQVRTCTVCGKQETRTVAAGRSWGECEQTPAPTCTQQGEQTRTCTVCGEQETRTVSAAGHSWGAWEQTTAPTCTEHGQEHRLCTVCGEEQVRDVPALDHSLTYVREVAATCTSEGVRAHYQCGVCHELFEDSAAKIPVTQEDLVIPVLSHNMQFIDEVSADCTSAGVKAHYHCTLCDEDFLTEEGGTPATADDLRIEPLGHTVQLVEKAEPTCTEAGVEEHYKCTRCGALFEDAEAKIPTSLQELTISAKGHTWGEWIYPDGYSCEQGGEVTRQCSVCGHQESQTIAAGEHTWAETGRVEAACEAGGYVDYKCSFCGTTKREELPAAGHKWSEWEVSKNATCTEAGEEKRTCENCGKEEKRTIQATDHSWGEWVTTKQPTCTQEGEQERTCANCSEKQTQPLSKLGHDMQYMEPTAATCAQAGNIEYYYCNRCDKYFSDIEGLHEITAESIVTPALDHSWGNWVTDKAAACEEDGLRHRTCERCHTEERETIKATGHSYNSTTHVCSVCGDIEETQNLTFALASPQVYPGGSYVLTSTGSNMGEVVLPATYNGKPVTGIASGAVLSGVTSVQIPNTQTFYIYGGALADTVSRINYLGDINGWAQLYFESGLAQGKYTLYTLSDSGFAAAKDVTITCNYVAAYAFENNAGLGAVTLSGVDRVEQFAFAQSSVTSFNSGGISALGYGAFAGCDKLASADLSSSSIAAINAMTFFGCKLSELKLPATLTSVAASAVPVQPAKLTFAGTSEQWSSVTIGAGNALENAICKVGA